LVEQRRVRSSIYLERWTREPPLHIISDTYATGQKVAGEV
jgi:hypothetical protein